MSELDSEELIRGKRPVTCLNLDSEELGGELVIDSECVVGLDVFCLGIFREDSLRHLSKRQRLHCPHQIPFRDVRLILYLLQAQSLLMYI